MSNQDLSETLTQVVTYILQRVSSSNAGDKDALIQEYSEWLQCLGNPYLICNNMEQRDDLILNLKNQNIASIN